MMVTIGGLEIPERIAGGLARYVLERVRTGDFLMAVLKNNLSEAVGQADQECLTYLANIVIVVYNHIPICGRRDNVEAFLSLDPDGHDAKAIGAHYEKRWRKYLQL